MTGRIVEETISIDLEPRLVFDAWTSAPRLAAWFAPMAVSEPEVTMEFEEGGAYRITMDLGPGGVHVTTGRFVEIVDGELIRMTWHCDAWADPPSQVEVRFERDRTGTLVRVKHTEITSESAREGQAFGWKACLGALGPWLATQHIGGEE